jgi:NAD(P)-dependent dehydrogenase (short-subunit alcohol dehydrogenase family)
VNQRVFIKAGAAGIGLAIAKAFATSGARMHTADVNTKAVQDITKQYKTSRSIKTERASSTPANSCQTYV